MAITDLGSLVDRVLDWADDTTVSEDVANECVQFATHTFNYGAPGIAPLRTRGMMKSEALTPASGIATLPDDYLQFRSVALATATPRLLSFMSPDEAVSLYGNNAAGIASSFTIIGDQLTLFPSNSSNVTLVYYQKIPDLVDEDDTNWVLDKHPNLYLHSSLYHVALYRRDEELAARHASLAMAVMEGIGGSDMVGTYGYALMRPRGMVVA